MKNIVEIAFKKLLGKGRAFKTPAGFMSDFLDLLVSPFSELKERFLNLKFSHFPTVKVLKDDILNGEELFEIFGIDGQTLEERAINIEAQWGLLAGSLNWKSLENSLRKMGINVRVVENVPQKAINVGSLSMYGNYQYNKTLNETNDFVRYGLNASRIIGNGAIELENEKKDPCNIQNRGVSQYGSFGYGGYNSTIDSVVQYGIKGGSDNCFFVVSDEPITSRQYELLTKIVLQKKPAHTVAICNLKIID